MNRVIVKLGTLVTLWAFPLLTFAQGKTLRDVIATVIGYFQVFITLIIGLAILTFIWNIYNYFFKADVENKKEAGLYVLYSTIGFFIILSFWGLVAILANSLNLPNTAPMWPFGTGSGAPAQNIFNTGGGGGLNSNNVGSGGLNSNNVRSGGLNSNNVGSGGLNSGNVSGPQNYNDAVGIPNNNYPAPQNYDEAVNPGGTQ